MQHTHDTNMYDWQHIAKTVESQLPEKRWQHTLGVASCAIALAQQYGVDPHKAHVAALLHDIAKYWSADRMQQVIVADDPHNDVLKYPIALWHAHVGAVVARTQFGIDDADICTAIRYHTSGRIGMSMLEKVLCVADYIEPNRNFLGVERIRELAPESIERALLVGLEYTIQQLIKKRCLIYPLTVLTRNELLRYETAEGIR